MKTILASLMLSVSIPMASHASAATQPGRAAPKKTAKNDSLGSKIESILQSGEAEVMPGAVAKDLGLQGDQSLRTRTTTRETPQQKMEKAFSVAYSSGPTGTKPLFLIWSLTVTTTLDGKQKYDSWNYKSDLAGHLQAAAHITGDDKDVEQAPAALDDTRLKAFEAFRDELTGRAASSSKK